MLSLSWLVHTVSLCVFHHCHAMVVWYPQRAYRYYLPEPQVKRYRAATAHFYSAKFRNSAAKTSHVDLYQCLRDKPIPKPVQLPPPPPPPLQPRRRVHNCFEHARELVLTLMNKGGVLDGIKNLSFVFFRASWLHRAFTTQIFFVPKNSGAPFTAVSPWGKTGAKIHGFGGTCPIGPGTKPTCVT